jgi:hypothetical protein
MTEGTADQGSMTVRLRHRLIALAALTLLAAPLGCAEVKDLWQLRTDLSERYGAVELNVDVSEGRRTLEIRLSPDLIEGGRAAERALDVARFAASTYARSQAVDRWVVIFGTSMKAGTFHFESLRGRYTFARSDL